MGNWEPGLWLRLRAQAGCPTLWGSQPSTKMSGRQGAGSKGQESRRETDPMSDRPGIGIYCSDAHTVWPLRVDASISSRQPHPGCLPERSFGDRQTNKRRQKKSRTRSFALENILGAELTGLYSTVTYMYSVCSGGFIALPLSLCLQGTKIRAAK